MVRIADRAKIALDTLPWDDRAVVDQCVQRLDHLGEDRELQSRVRPLRELSNTFLAEATPMYLVVFETADAEVTVVDVVRRDRVERLFGNGAKA